ncbi:MAG: hypothetical protein WBC37_00700 [Burkholderiaceae bacterium]
MRNRTLLLSVAALLLSACGGSELDPAGGSAAAATGGMAQAMGTTAVGSSQVTTVDLGLLSGGTVASARAINNLGKVIGTATDSTYAIQRVMWDASSTNPPAVVLPNYDPSITAEPESINDGGEVAGTERISSTLREGVYWAPGGSYSAYGLAPLNGGSRAQITAHGINSNGVIAGSAQDGGTGHLNAVVWNRNTAPKAVVVSGEAFDVNDALDVVGVYTHSGQSRAFLARSGGAIDLGAVGGAGTSSRAVAINNKGMIAGTSDADTIAVAWTYDTTNATSTPVLKQLPLPTGLVLPAPAAINDNGDIVGSATTSNYSGKRAVLWRNGQAIQLATFNSRAFGINNAGQIVGEGDINGNGMNRALLWTVSTGTTTAAKTVANTAPTVSITSLSSTSLKLGTSLVLQASVKDPDNGPWTYTVAWGDGTVTKGSIAATGSVSASRAYVSASPKKGYTVSITVTDAAGGSGSASRGGIRVSP